MPSARPMPFATLPPSIPHSRSFFSAKPTFFPRSGFFFGGEGCEWDAKQPTVGKSGDKAENEFSGFIPLAVPRLGASPHIPAPDFLFISIHQNPTIPPNLTKSSSRYQK